MSLFKRLFHFLSGIHFAIALILTAALTVIAGTLIESKTASHLLAARWTYEHPFFQVLLLCFFINILFSALHRWPFQKKHIPFLITHLGLLMVIAGTILKFRYGLQGQMSVWEGSGSAQVTIPNTFAIHVEGKERSASLVALPSFQPRLYFPFDYPDVKCKIIGYASHVTQKPETWIKENKAYLAGVPPLPVDEWTTSSPFPKGSIHLKARGKSLQPFNITALRTPNVEDAYRQAYLQGLHVRLKMKNDQAEALEIPLEEALASQIAYAEGWMTTSLHLPLSVAENVEPAFIRFQWISLEGNEKEDFLLSLKGTEALLVHSNTSNDWKPRFTVDLIRPHPALCFVENLEAETTLFAFDTHGRVHSEKFNPSDLKAYISYDQGFGGYSVQAIIPYPSFLTSRQEKEKALAHAFAQQLKQALSATPPLTPPLLYFQQACQKAQVDFAETFAQFLLEWFKAPGVSFRPDKPLPASLVGALKHLDWKNVTAQDQQALLWTSRLLEQLGPDLQTGEALHIILERNRWPFLSAFKEQCDNSKEHSALNVLAGQLAGVVPSLPPLEFPTQPSIQEHAALLSAFFRLYGIDHQLLLPPHQGADESFEGLEAYWKAQKVPEDVPHDLAMILETPLTQRIVPDTAPLKLEECRPGIVAEFQQGQEKQTIALAYDPQATGMKWPVLKGKFLVRFQPSITELPYRMRLRQARQLYYPQSSQVYSYESDVLVSHNNQVIAEPTLSMNHVYETWDGYRFYLSGIGSSTDGTMKRIQLAVNHDPAKYSLTYPGAALVFLGIVLLFWIFPFRK